MKLILKKSKEVIKKMNEVYVGIGEASELLGVSASTLRNWDKQGILVPKRRLSSGKRFYTTEQLNRVISKMEENK